MPIPFLQKLHSTNLPFLGPKLSRDNTPSIKTTIVNFTFSLIKTKLMAFTLTTTKKRMERQHLLLKHLKAKSVVYLVGLR
jgi:hypothetical protein